jgi:hypothetical protein
MYMKGVEAVEELMGEAKAHIERAEVSMHRVSPEKAVRNLHWAATRAARALLEAKRLRVAGEGEDLVREVDRLYVRTGEMPGRFLRVIEEACSRTGQGPQVGNPDLRKTFEDTAEFVRAVDSLLVGAELNWAQGLGDLRYDFTPPPVSKNSAEFGERVMSAVVRMRKVDEDWKGELLDSGVA